MICGHKSKYIKQEGHYIYILAQNFSRLTMWGTTSNIYIIMEAITVQAITIQAITVRATTVRAITMWAITT